jgi:hypothetical protein
MNSYGRGHRSGYSYRNALLTGDPFARRSDRQPQSCSPAVVRSRAPDTVPPRSGTPAAESIPSPRGARSAASAARRACSIALERPGATGVSRRITAPSLLGYRRPSFALRVRSSIVLNQGCRPACACSRLIHGFKRAKNVQPPPTSIPQPVEFGCGLALHHGRDPE